MKTELLLALVLLAATAIFLSATQPFLSQAPDRPGSQQIDSASLTTNKDVYAALSLPVTERVIPPLDRTHVADNALCYDRFAPDCEAPAVLRGNADRTYLRTGNVLGGRVDVD